MHTDGISETIAHFIGLFKIEAEGDRLRLDYDEFTRAEAPPPQGELEPPPPPALSHLLELGPNNPLVRYTPDSWENSIPAAAQPIDIKLPFADLPDGGWRPSMPEALQVGAYAPPSFGPMPLEGPVPGSVGLIIAQAAYLHDNDTVVIGNPDGPLPVHAADRADLDALLAEIQAFSGPLADIPADDIYHQIPEFVASAAEAAHAMAAVQSTPTMTVTSAVGAQTAGTHVNGTQANEVPSLSDYWPIPEEEEEEPEPLHVSELTIEPGGSSMEVTTGQNMLANQVVLMDAGLTPSIIAVAGDYVRLDVISQVNAYSDNDTVDAGFPAGGGSPTQAMNIAGFSSGVLDTTSQGQPADPEAMPANWTVSVLEGDLVFLQWITQYSFASDDDLLVLTATGTSTTLGTGENAMLNDMRFSDLGLYYDIVIVGGNLYDANVICQTNVLYDDDTLQMMCDTGELPGSFSTSGNLLWNQASINFIGPQGSSGPLPGHYTDAMEGLGSGDKAMPSGFSDDPALAGTGHLRVLYITGDVYDLRYVEQTTILSDADHVAVYEQGLLDHPDTEWSISTGENAQANVATIVDYASAGDTLYVGGDTYTDAVLIQAEIVDDKAGDNGGLASELVAFLENEPALLPATEAYAPPSTYADAAPADVMQSMLA
jgi:hypothetical protein